MLQLEQKIVKIALIDSGIDYKRAEFDCTKIHLLNECKDQIGHGTAVASIIHKISPNAELYVYRLFDSDEATIDAEQLIEVLIFLKQFGFDIVHLSCGVVVSNQLDALRRACTDLINDGTIIICAYDDYGRISYPAAFDNVIGVDWDIRCSDGLKYTFVQDSPVNILGIGALMRLPWLNGGYQTVAGSSFSAPYITGLVANLLMSGEKPKNVMEQLRCKAAKEISVNKPNFTTISKDICIKKAIIYPVNKEIHNLLTYVNLLKFEIVGVYEPAIFRNVGKKAEEICGFGESSLVVESEKKIQWDSDFDTLILGHTRLYEQALRKDIIKEFMEKCVVHNKNLFAFDDLGNYDDLVKTIRDNGNFCYYPRVDTTDVDRTFLNKLHGIYSPVLGVVGTSSKQGKFSLQLALKTYFEKQGYNIGSLGTEPSSLLFGFTHVYPMGYECNVHLSESDSIRAVNRFMHEIDTQLPDLIIVGGQSQTVPYSMGNLALYPLLQNNFLLGAEPDAVILCVNPYDTLDYIQRTINYLNGYINTKVVAISIYPKSNYFEWAIYGTHSYYVENKILEERRQCLEKELGIPCVVFHSKDDVETLAKIVIEFFSST